MGPLLGRVGEAAHRELLLPLREISARSLAVSRSIRSVWSRVTTAPTWGIATSGSSALLPQSTP